MRTTTTKACSVPMILAALAVFSCVFLVHAAAAATNYNGIGYGYRRALLPKDEEAAVVMPAAVGMAGVVEAELPAIAAGEEEIVMRRMDMQTQDYPGSGANSRHDPRNPH